MPTIPVDWKKIEMNNWAQHTSKIDDVHVRLNDGAVPTLVLLPSPVEGDDIFQLYTISLSACYNVVNKLYNKIGLDVGQLELNSKAEFLVYDPTAKSFCKNGYGQITYDGIAKVNASPPRHIGEIEFHDPRALLDYITMPQRLQNVEAFLEKVLDALGLGVEGEIVVGQIKDKDEQDKGPNYFYC